MSINRHSLVAGLLLAGAPMVHAQAPAAPPPAAAPHPPWHPQARMGNRRSNH